MISEIAVEPQVEEQQMEDSPPPSEAERQRVLADATADLNAVSGLTTTQIDRMIQSFKNDNE